ncbi:MAG: hypothetical protein H6Q89_2117, partial [Myxococcaceae bacterium]|nr:hypothetical protein [Myxococcaceae bacterium]
MKLFRVGPVLVGLALVASGCSCNNVPPSFEDGGAGG